MLPNLLDTDRRVRGALTMKAASSSVTSVSIYQSAERSIPRDSHLHIRRNDNLKSQQVKVVLIILPQFIQPWHIENIFEFLHYTKYNHVIIGPCLS